MGIFRKDKNKVTVKDVGRMVAHLVTKWHTRESCKTFSEALLNSGRSPVLNEKQTKEILILRMFAATWAVQNVFEGSEEEKKVLDEFHDVMYKAIYSSKSERREFAELVNDRYQSYCQVLSSMDDKELMNFGELFGDYFLNCNHTPELRLIFLAVSDFAEFGKVIQYAVKEILPNLK